MIDESICVKPLLENSGILRALVDSDKGIDFLFAKEPNIESILLQKLQTTDYETVVSCLLALFKIEQYKK